jgi:carbonic anhydrase/acetyltransferase-like protein (isoleucine patch superfamily)
VIHGCSIGNRCLIGMGTVVLDNAVIGDDCFVAAGSLVTPGTEIPPRSFVVGRPAKVLRPVSERETEWIRRAAENYVRYARDFRTGCKLVG